MKNLFRTAAFLPLLILLTACPYESSVPITEANKPLNKKLLGKWYKDGEMDQENPSEYYEITADSENLFKITKFDYSEDDDSYSEEVYISHISSLKDKSDKKYTFLNMKKDGNFYLHKIELSAERFVLFEVTDNIDEKFNTPAEMKAFVKKNMHLSFFYNKDEVTYYKGDHTK